jgi:hypothetical protein
MPVAHIGKGFIKTTGFQVSSLHKHVYLAILVFLMIDANSCHKPRDPLSFFHHSL